MATFYGSRHSYDGDEKYLDSIIYLFGRRSAELFQMEPGTYNYNFKLNLPSHIPESISASKGFINYSIEVVLDIPWKLDKETKKNFIVFRNDNLNHYPELTVPLRQEDIRTFHSFSLKSGSCGFKIKIPHRGYGSGQAIPIKIECNNLSQTDITQTKIMFKRIIAFTSFVPEVKKKSKIEILAEIIVAGVRKGNAKNIDCALRTPPNLLNSNSLYCRVVNVSYSLEIEFIVGGLNSNPKFIFPITIGAVGVEDLIDRNTRQGTGLHLYTPQYTDPFSTYSSMSSLPPPYTPDTPCTVDFNEFRKWKSKIFIQGWDSL